MPDYAISMVAQQWNTDSYYVASSAPKYPITVVAETKQDGIEEAVRTLGPAERGRYWRFLSIEMKDVRLVPVPTTNEGDTDAR